VPSTKNPLRRYKIIDRCLRTISFPDKKYLRSACEEELYGGGERNEKICNSTIEKDMLTMREEYDAPIAYNRLKKGYYYTDPNFSMDGLPLTNSDVNALRFAANTLSQFKDVEVFSEFGNAIDKIIERLSLSMHTKPKELKQYVQFETNTSTGGGQHLLPILSAIQQGIAIYFEYENFRKKTIKPRKVRPLLLKEYRNRWYVISYDLVKETIVTYALERINNLEISKESISQPYDFNPQEFFKYSVGISTKETTPEIIKFVATETATKYLQTQPFHESQKIVEQNQTKTKYEICAFVSEELIREILAYGNEITVLEPQSLRLIITKRITQMVNNYQINT